MAVKRSQVERDLSRGATQVLAALPATGASVGNGRLRSELGMADSEYRAAVQELESRGLVRRGRGRGGSLARVSIEAVAPPPPRLTMARQQ